MSARSGRTPHGILNFPPIFPRISTSGPVCYLSSEAPGCCRNQSRLRDIVDRIVLSKISVTFLFFRFRIKMKESKLSNYPWIDMERTKSQNTRQNIRYSKDTCFSRFLIKCAYVIHRCGL